MRVRKLLSNNAAVVLDEQNRERVITGKGIGYHKKTGDEVDSNLIEKVFYLSSNDLNLKLQEVIAFLPIEEIRMEEARKVVETRGQSESVQLLKELFGTGVESVETAPSAFAITSLAKGNPWEAVRLSADIGGDTDTLGAITGAICGAMTFL